MRAYKPSAFLWVVTALMVSYFSGCASNRPASVATPIFCPPSPDPPRLQFLVSFSDGVSWLERRSPFADLVVGAKQEKHGTIKIPYGIAARDGRLYICDLGARLIHVIDLTQKSYRVLGTPDQIQNPVNITIDAEDRFLRYLGNPQRCVPIDLAIWGDELFVVDIAGARVEAWSKEGKFLRAITTKGPGPDQLGRPTNLG